jgi:hypothetical protein
MVGRYKERGGWVGIKRGKGLGMGLANPPETVGGLERTERDNRTAAHSPLLFRS